MSHLPAQSVQLLCSLLLYINKWHNVLVLPAVWLQKDAQFSTLAFSALVMSVQAR